MLAFRAFLLVVLAIPRAASAQKIYGLNLGSWLLTEPWMLPEGWVAMGGERCEKCQDCIASEYAFVKTYPDTADTVFAKHWATWFTKTDVDRFVELGINTVRIPMGYWIVEALVDRSSEYYPRGGIKYLAEGLGWLKDAGIRVVFDHHALPGVASANQMFAGRCTDDVQFYTPYNYHRALIWSAVMTAISHIHPNFESVFSIQAINEPVQDANKTPGYGDFQVAFVQTVRLMELLLGVYTIEECAQFGFSAQALLGVVSDLEHSSFASASANVTITLGALAGVNETIFSPDATLAVAEALPIILEIILDIGLGELGAWGAFKGRGAPLTTNFMDFTWQYTGPAANPADAAIGPQSYDNHLYLSYGGVADANPDAYLTYMCNLPRVADAKKNRNTPLWFGEWAVSTNFNATPQFMSDWADAQKMQYSADAGWFFWNFKIEDSSSTRGLVEQWSYYKGIELGWFTKDPSQFNNPHVCDNYTKSASTPPTSASTPQPLLSIDLGPISIALGGASLISLGVYKMPYSALTVW